MMEDIVKERKSKDIPLNVCPLCGNKTSLKDLKVYDMCFDCFEEEIDT